MDEKKKDPKRGGNKSNMNEISKHRRLLIGIANELTTDDLRNLKFLCADIPNGRREQIVKAVDFLEELESRALLSEGNYEYLGKLLALDLIGRQDLAKELQEGL